MTFPPGALAHSRAMTDLRDRTYARVISGLEIFSAGTHTDSSGQTDEFTAEHLDAMIAAFDGGTPEVVPIKLGHTSSEFNDLVAKALSVPKEVLQGEGGEGAASLGRVARLSRVQNKLVADLEVPDELVSLVESEYFKNVSSELVQRDGEGWMLSAVALLGAERPAVKDIEPLAAAAVLHEPMKPARVYSQSLTVTGVEFTKVDVDAVNTALESAIKGRQGASAIRAVWNDIKKRISRENAAPPFGKDDDDDDDDDAKKKKKKPQMGEDEMLNKILGLIGFDEDDTPDETTAIAKVTELVESARSFESAKVMLSKIRRALGLAEDADEEAIETGLTELKERTVKFKDSSDFKAALETATAPLAASIAELKHDKRVMELSEQTRTFTAIEGTPAELAGRLIAIEDKMGEKVMKQTLVEWKTTQKYAEGAGALKGVGGGGDGTPPTPADDHPFMVKVRKHAKTNQIDENTALVAMSAQDPRGFAEYHDTVAEIVDA